MVVRLVAFFQAHQVARSVDGHVEIFFDGVPIAIDPEITVVDEDGVETPELFLNLRLHNICELVEEDEVVHATFAVTGFVVFCVGLFAAFLSDHHGLETEFFGAFTDFQSAVSPEHPNGDLGKIVVFEDFRKGNHSRRR